jgi:cytochrome P450
VVLVGEQVVAVAVWAQENEVPSSRARPSLATSGTRGTPAAAIASLPLTTRLASTAEQATLLVRAMLPAGLDTTVIVIGNLLRALAYDPGRWALLREIPGNVRFAVDPPERPGSHRAPSWPKANR